MSLKEAYFFAPSNQFGRTFYGFVVDAGELCFGESSLSFISSYVLFNAVIPVPARVIVVGKILRRDLHLFTAHESTVEFKFILICSATSYSVIRTEALHRIDSVQSLDSDKAEHATHHLNASPKSTTPFLQNRTE